LFQVRFVFMLVLDFGIGLNEKLAKCRVINFRINGG